MDLRHRLPRILDYPGRYGDRLIAAIGALLLLTYLTATIAFPKKNGQIVVGDAKHHYVQLRSLVFDGDLDFRNEYSAWSAAPVPVSEWHLTPTGHVRNYMPVGPALLWLPPYVLIVILKYGAAWLGLGLAPTGYERSLQLVPGVMGVLASILATLLTWRMAARFTDRANAVMGAVAVWLGSHALYYALVSPAYSHTASMLTSAGFCWYWLNPQASYSVRRAAWLGGLAGLCALMRWQDALFVIVPAWESLRWQAAWKWRVVALVAAWGAWLVAFAPQMAVWGVLYGQPFALPQGASFMQWTKPHLFDVLFSVARGLFAWAPLLALAMAGLCTFLARYPAWRVALIAMLTATWYVNAAVADWWGGEAFGARRFLSLTPLFAVGLAIWLSRPTPTLAPADQTGAPHVARSPWRIALVGALMLANGLLLLQYQLALKGFEAIAPFPAGFFDMWVVRFLLPFRILGWGG